MPTSARVRAQDALRRVVEASRRLVERRPAGTMAAACALGLVFGWGVFGALWPAPWALVEVPASTAAASGASRVSRLPAALAVGLLAGFATFAWVQLAPLVKVARTRRRSRMRLAQRAQRTGDAQRPPAVPHSTGSRAGPDKESGLGAGQEHEVEPSKDAEADQDGGAEPDRVVDSYARPTPARPQPTAPGVRWQPEPIHLGRTISTRYLGPDLRFHRSWLVFEGEDNLVGGAGMRARQSELEGVLLEIWLFDRDEASASDPPIVALATPRAFAAIGAVGTAPPAPAVVEAVSGRHFSLTTNALVLFGVVAEAVADSSGLAFQTLTLDLRATRNQSAEA